MRRGMRSQGIMLPRGPRCRLVRQLPRPCRPIWEEPCQRGREVAPVCSVCSVCLVCLVCLVYLVDPDQLDERNKPDRHFNGTLIVRSSTKCTMISSSLTSMLITQGSTIFAAVLMPILLCRFPAYPPRRSPSPSVYVAAVTDGYPGDQVLCVLDLVQDPNRSNSDAI